MSDGDLMQARAARPEDVEPMLQVLCAAFQIDIEAARPLIEQDPFFDLSHKRILISPSDGLVSCLTVIPASLRIGDALIPVAGIAGVATLPALQGRGYAGLLLRATVGAIKDDLNYSVAALFPYSYGFYRRFGWETASHVSRWEGLASCLPRYAEATHVRAVQPGVAPERIAIRRLHERMTQGRTGAFLRDARRWKVIETLSPTREAFVYESRAGVIEGYLFFERRCVNERETFVVHEMHGLSEAVRRGLLGFLARQGDGQTRVEWEASPADLLLVGLLSLPDFAAHLPQITLAPGMMLRLVDLPSALARLHPSHFAPILTETSGTITIRAVDPIRPQNERPVRLHKSGVLAGSQSDRDWITASIQVFARLYTGCQTPSEAASLGQLSASSRGALMLADRLFPARQPFVAPPDQF